MVDRYTKIILTVIAANLTLMTLKSFNVVPSAEASRHTIQKVRICDLSNCAMVSRGGNLNVSVY